MQDMNDTCEKITHTKIIDRGFTVMYTVKPHAHAHTHTHTEMGVHTLISDLCKIQLVPDFQKPNYCITRDASVINSRNDLLVSTSKSHTHTLLPLMLTDRAYSSTGTATSQGRIPVLQLQLFEIQWTAYTSI